MDKDNKQKIQKRFKGEVVSDKSDKTIVVRIDQSKVHPIYKKSMKTSRKYKVHDPKDQYNVGDIVEFVGCRPISKDKKWRVVYSQK